MSSLDTTEAAQEAIELAKDEVHSLSESSNSRSCSSQPRHSPTPPRTASLIDVVSLYDSDESFGSEENYQDIIEVRPCSSPNTEKEFGISARRPQASDQASSSEVNDLRPVSLKPSDHKVAEGIAQDVDENGNWIFLGHDMGNKPRGTVRRGSGARVKDEDGHVTWRDVRSPNSSASSTR